MTITTSSAAAFNLLSGVRATGIKMSYAGEHAEIAIDIEYQPNVQYSIETVEVCIAADGTWAIYYAGTEELGKDCIWSLFTTADLSMSDLDAVQSRFLAIAQQSVAVIKGVLGGEVDLSQHTGNEVDKVEATLRAHEGLILDVANS